MKEKRVILPFGHGTWREEITVNKDKLVLVPDTAKIHPFQLAMATVNPPSAYLLLTQYVTLNQGDWIIQNAANSAVGQSVILIAKNWGLKTVNVVRRESLIEELRNIGGDIVLLDGPDLAKRVAKATNKVQIKLGLDAVAGSATHRISQCLVFGGTVVNYGAMSLKRCEFGASQTIFKQINLQGLWFQKWREVNPKKGREIYQKTYDLIFNGNLKTKIDSTYPLINIQQALDHAMQDKRKGKILITGPAFK